MLINIVLFILRMRGGVNMVDIYVALIIYGRRTFEQVPSILQSKVEEELTALSLNTDGTPVQE
ncbi:hypothetical protein ERL59_20225 [Chengkuizengella sp. YPA3-1-1]|uniref:Uncharacterized protein n=1 Tax=Chengkuizengella marina TaxID=2507566 RepID=A0A6N9Q8N6_9BACL|nr:hypothetical protein [Chengkuizengella marina]